LALAIIGLTGVIAYTVSQRTKEIGVRMALGAAPRDVLWLILRQGLALGAIGLAIGLAGSLALTRFLSSLLYGVSATDPLTFLGVSLLLAATTLLACYIPARRAALTDPLTSLRRE
jgi:putative ABC transport system permease protein